ncbi:MAG: P1 family peptidase [Hyphomicrobiaceae bacterium]
MRNLITDVAGLSVGNAHDPTVASGVTVAIFDEPAVASVAIHGGAPGVCDTALLEPEASVERVDALFLSGGSAFGLSAGGGVLAYLRARGRGFQVGNIHVPIAPGAVLFDLAQAGATDWSGIPPWWELGYRAAAEAASRFDLGTAGAGFGATTANVKGGLGSSSATTSEGFTVGALVAVNAVGSALIGDGPHFWAGLDEHESEFGGLGSPAHLPPTAFDMAIKGDGNPRANTTIAMVATDALLTKAQARRVAIMAHDGLARAIRPSHAPMDGDLIFAAATGKAKRAPDLRQLSDIGFVAARCMARAVAIGIYRATSLPAPGSLPAYRDRFRP